jgi:uncharacterized protein YjbI with pentapeptide repeats
MAHVIRTARLVGTVLTVFGLAAPAAASAAPLVPVENAKLAPSASSQTVAVVSADIHWNQAAARALSNGDVRVVALSARERRATLLAKSSTKAPLPQVEHVAYRIPRRFASAITSGNRVVLTATQHQFNPSPVVKSPRVFVTVAEVQPPRTRDHIGRSDCSDREIHADGDYIGCDLVGAWLERTQVSRGPKRTDYERADLSGSTMAEADLTRANFAGGRVNGADARGATFDNTSMAQTQALELDASGAQMSISSSDFPNARFVDANFRDATFLGTSFIHATLDGAHMEGVKLIAADMTTVSARGTHFDRAVFGPPPSLTPSLYFADLAGADFTGAAFPFSSDPDGPDLKWSLLCATVLPNRKKSDRDCTG